MSLILLQLLLLACRSQFQAWSLQTRSSRCLCWFAQREMYATHQVRRLCYYVPAALASWERLSTTLLLLVLQPPIFLFYSNLAMDRLPRSLNFTFVRTNFVVCTAAQFLFHDRDSVLDIFDFDDWVGVFFWLSRWHHKRPDGFNWPRGYLFHCTSIWFRYCFVCFCLLYDAIN